MPRAKNSQKSNTRRKSSSQDKPSLHKAEYDFSRIPKEEWETAYEYEFNREVIRYKKFRDGNRQAYFELSRDEEPLFPIPWLRLPEEEKEYLLQNPEYMPAPNDPSSPPVRVWCADLAFMTDSEKKDIDRQIALHRAIRVETKENPANSVFMILEINTKANMDDIRKDFDAALTKMGVKRKQSAGKIYKHFMDLSVFRLKMAGFSGHECIVKSKWMNSDRTPVKRTSLGESEVSKCKSRIIQKLEIFCTSK